MFKRLTLLLLLLCPFALPAAPAITVSGNSVTILGSAQTISLTCTLIDPNNTGNLRSGSNIITTFITSTTTPSNVATCGPIYGNDVITDGYGNANTTYYKVQVFTVSGGIIASTPSLQQFYAFTGSGTIDLATATPLAPSFFTGPTGNVVMPGTLTVTGATTLNGSATLNGAATTTNTLAANGTNTLANMNGVLYVGGSAPQVGGSADMGAQINAAYALLPANGGIITLLPQASGACYNYSTPIVMAVVGKFAILQGLGVNAFTASNFTGACLNYTPTTATKAISIDWGAASGSGNTPGSGLRDFTLINNACSTAGGCGSSAIGVDIGGTNGGLGENGIFSNVQVMGFGTGYKREDSSGVSWGTKWINSPVRFNTTGILSLASENDNYIGGAINSNGTGVNLNAFGAELTIDGGSCDADTTACVNLANGATLHTSDLHWENTGGSTSHFVTSGSVGSFLDIKGGTMFDDTAVGTTDNYFTAGIISAKGLILQSSGRTISGGSVFNCLTTCDINVIAGNSTLPQSVLLNTSSAGNVSGAIVGNRFAQYAGPVTAGSLISAQGVACTNGELALSAGWQSTGSATVTAVKGLGQTCEWTITTGTTTAANPTVTDTLTNVLPNATTVCEMIITGGNRTPAAGDGFDQTTLSATAPVFTFQGTPTAGGKTYQVVRRCGP